MLSLLLALCGLALLAILFWLTDAGRRALRRRWDAWRQRPHLFRVTRRIDHDETHFSLHLTPVGGKCRPFIAGQYLTVLGPLLPAGNHAERRYSLDRWDASPGEYGLTIKKEPMGRVSGWLHETIREGDELQCRLPEGDFVLPEIGDNAPIVLIAAGVGITPLRSMIHALRARASGPVTLFFTARSLPGLIFHEEFETLAREWTSFRYHARLTGQDDMWEGNTGRFSAADLVTADNGRAHYLFCASHAMIEDLSQGLRDKGV
ncbi:MAG: FAD-binding oxidoreductase, partial [Dechloromonas sp.]|nr:FAD-binding oxidoreductase [Dechloromonas sp.]